MNNHPKMLYVYRCDAGHTLFRRARTDSTCARCRELQVSTDEPGTYDFVVSEIANSHMIDFAYCVQVEEGTLAKRRERGKPMRFIERIDREESETEINHELRAVHLKESSVN